MLLAGQDPSPIVAVLTSPDVITAGTALLVALVTWLRITKFGQVLDGLTRLTSAVDELRVSDREHDARMARLETQIEGVRNDARTDRAHLYDEVHSLHGRIDRVKTETLPLRQES